MTSLRPGSEKEYTRRILVCASLRLDRRRLPLGAPPGLGHLRGNEGVLQGAVAGTGRRAHVRRLGRADTGARADEHGLEPPANRQLLQAGLCHHCIPSRPLQRC